MHEQKWPIEIACFGIKNRLPSGTMHAILQMHSILTRTHSILFNFLDEGGLPTLPPLPTSSPFSAFDNVAATIIRYIPEVPHLVQRSPKKLILVWRLVTAKRSWSQRMWVRLLICQYVDHGENFIESWPTCLTWRELRCWTMHSIRMRSWCYS